MVESKDRLVTARIGVLLPFRTSVKEGDLYEPIAKTLDNNKKVTVYPLERSVAFCVARPRSGCR